MRPRSREALIVVTTAMLLAVVFTWPLAARLGSAGRVDSGDGRYSVWNVAWVARALTTNPRQLFDANIFYPHHSALAFSEANIVAGVLAIPVWLLTGNALAAANSTILLAFALSAISMYLLVRHLTSNVTAAAVSGISYAFCPYVFAHIPHAQLLMTFGIPLALLELHRFVTAPSARVALRLGVVLAVQGLACGYYGIFAGLVVGVGLTWFGVFNGRWADWRYWTLALLAATVAVAIVGPFLLPYVEIRRAGFGRSLEDARLFSAGWRAYLASAGLFHRWMLPLIGSWREVLFPGFIPLGLAVIAVVRTWLPGTPDRRTERRVIGFYLVLGALAMWASFGPDAGLYTALFKTVPFFNMLRAPGRFGVIVTAATAIVAGFGVVSLERAIVARRRGIFRVAIVMLILARSSVGPLDLVPMPPPTRADRVLAGLPDAPLIYFPFFTGAVDRHRQTEYMLESTYHWQPLVNGYSDYFPAEAFADAPVLATFPSTEAWRVMRDHHVRYVAVHWGSYDPDQAQTLRRTLRREGAYLRVVVGDPDVSLYEVLTWPEGS
jgi:hypothetical protein